MARMLPASLRMLDASSFRLWGEGKEALEDSFAEREVRRMREGSVPLRIFSFGLLSICFADITREPSF